MQLIIAGLIAPTLSAWMLRFVARPSPHPACSSLRIRGGGKDGFAAVAQLTKLVEETNACALPGCTIKYDSFMPILWRAVQRGWVAHDDAVFVADGLRHGFTAGVQRVELHGQRVFKNYKSAVVAMEQVGRATQARLDSGKSICLGEWSRVNSRLREEVKEFYIFPLGAVPKPLEPTEVRPASDHTRTGLIRQGCRTWHACWPRSVARSDTVCIAYVSVVTIGPRLAPMARTLPWRMACGEVPGTRGTSAGRRRTF